MKIGIIAILLLLSSCSLPKKVAAATNDISCKLRVTYPSKEIKEFAVSRGTLNIPEDMEDYRCMILATHDKNINGILFHTTSISCLNLISGDLLLSTAFYPHRPTGFPQTAQLQINKPIGNGKYSAHIFNLTCGS